MAINTTNYNVLLSFLIKILMKSSRRLFNFFCANKAFLSLIDKKNQSFCLKKNLRSSFLTLSPTVILVNKMNFIFELNSF